MPDPANPVTGRRGQRALTSLLIALSAISSLGLGLWAWIEQHRSQLPALDTKAGRELLQHYQDTTHQIWLILLGITCSYLLTIIYRSRQQEQREAPQPSTRRLESWLYFVRHNPITTVLFVAYAVGMVAGTTYLYRDMLGWYPELVNDHFIDNFSARESFIDETMRRIDYRFFPLAHQDIHVLSWFTIHIKTWMLISAAELAGIVLLSMRFLNDLLQNHAKKPSTLLLLATAFLIHPATGTAFFQVIFCERLLCLIFMLYITTYLRYRQSKQQSDFHWTLLWGLLGIYIKDIALLLFVIPPATLWIKDAMTGARHGNNRLEHWLCSLSLVFIASYIILAFIPSSFAADGAYNSDASHQFTPDLRFCLFAILVSIRVVAIWTRRVTLNMLDAINAAGVAYAIALSATYAFDATSYLALPVQLIATINIGWAWILLVETHKNTTTKPRTKVIGAMLISALLIGVDHISAKQTFAGNVYSMKAEQSAIQTTYEKLYNASRKIRNSGDDVNIIINAKSRFAANRHLNRIVYRSLIEYEPDQQRFTVKDGANKRSEYTPQVGDLIANLDKSNALIDPILDGLETEVIYRYPNGDSGVILRITAIKP